MKINKDSSIDWTKALDRLSIGAFYLLNVMYRKDIEINDKLLMELTGKGVSTHRKHKRELFDCSYIKANQIGKGTYEYTIGELDG